MPDTTLTTFFYILLLGHSRNLLRVGSRVIHHTSLGTPPRITEQAKRVQAVMKCIYTFRVCINSLEGKTSLACKKRLGGCEFLFDFGQLFFFIFKNCITAANTFYPRIGAEHGHILILGLPGTLGVMGGMNVFLIRDTSLHCWRRRWKDEFGNDNDVHQKFGGLPFLRSL